MRAISCIQHLAVVAVLAASPVFAQHEHDDHHHHRTPWHRTTTIFDQHGHRVTANFDQYGYVIPSSQQYRSTYYTNNNVRYFHDHHQHGGRVSRPAAMVFGELSHTDELAARLEFLANEFCLDLHYNYRHNPGFAETYREAYDLLQQAKAAHNEEHRGHRDHLIETITKMDPLFHHVEEDVETWSRDHHRQVGQLGIIDKMQQMEAVIHHMLYDAGVEPQHHDEHGAEQAPAPGGGPETAPPPAP